MDRCSMTMSAGWKERNKGGKSFERCRGGESCMIGRAEL